MESYSPVLVGCLIDCSVDVLTEWSDILQYYLNPIFYSIATATKRGSDVIRIGLVTYGDCESPSPICARRFFASAPLILKEDMMGDPFGLGLGTVASNNHGMSVLEGYVALLEMFDAAEITRPRPNAQSQTEEKPYEPIFYLIHIASSGPDKMIKPAFNNNPAFDNVTWETLPAEISKRKMRHNLILLRSVGELIELSKTLNGPTASFGILPRKPMHKLLLAGLPHVENKTVPLKRPLSDQDGASAAKHPHPPSHDQSGSSVIQASPVKPPTVVPSSQPQRLPTVNQLKGLLAHTDNEIRKKVKELQELVASNAPKERIETLQRALTVQNQGRSKIMLLLSQLIGQQVPRGTAGPGSAIHPVTGPSNQLVPGQATIAPKAGVFTQPVGASNPINSVVPVKGDVPVRTSGGAGIDVQLSKMIAERTRPPVLAAAPQTQGQPQPTTTAPPSSEPQPTQPAGQGVMKLSSEELIQIMDMPTQISNYPRRWEGFLSWPTALPTGERRELTLQVAFFSDPNLNTNWPKKLALQAGKKAVDPAFLQACIKEFKPSMGLITPWPSVGNAEMSVRNYRLYVGMREVFFHRSTVGIALMDIPNGPKGAGMVFLPVKSPQRALITMVFHQTPVPVNIITLLDLPVNPNPPTQSNATGSTNTMPLQMTPEAQAYLQQQRNNALNAYTQQQVLAQQAQRQAMLPAAGAPMSAGVAYNINQFFQNMQAQAQAQPQGYVGQGPQMQQVQHRQPSGGYTPAQIAQMVQFGMNRPPDGGQGA